MAKRMKIRIRTKAGKLIERNALVETHIDHRDRFRSVAQVGIHLYKIVGCDTYGAIWGR